MPNERPEEFCRRRKIAKRRLFGSALREGLGPGSDVALLVSFSPDAERSFLDHMAMEEDLSSTLGRKVDLVSRRGMERGSNWSRRTAILESSESWWGTEPCR